MRKIFNTFKYGDGRTKLVLLLTILAGAGTIAFFVLALILDMMFLFFGGVICAFVTITLAQTFGISGESIPMAKPVQDSAIDNILNNVEHNGSSPEETVGNKSGDKADDIGDNQVEDKEDDIGDNQVEDKKDDIGYNQVEDKEDDSDNNKSKKRSKNKKDKIDGEVEDTDNGSVSGDSRYQESDGDTDPVYVKEVLEKYTKKTIKKTLHKYKVKKDHRMVIIDNCKKLGIWQAPAYVWVADKEFNILVIEGEPRHLTLPVFSIKEVTYLKKQPGNEEKDYALFKGNSIVANIFRPYLPDYSYSTKVDDLTPYKNLYGIGPDIYFTNNSAANIFDLLGVKFYVEDKITTSNKANYFFKEIYKCNILLRDNVFDANKYADKVSGILDDMAHSTISHNEFRDTLNLLIKNKLITQEFASHFAEVRDKISR